MWEICGDTRRILITATLGLAFLSAPAFAVDTTVYQNNSQTGITLPNVALQSGSDEIRAGDGTSCRSTVGGDGAYIDSGVIASPGGNGLDQSGTIYSRVVIPLGEKPKRLDCSSLYDLEVQRLRMELQLAKMGLEAHGQTTSSITTSKITNSATAQAVNDSWSTEGLQTKQAAKPKKLPKVEAIALPEPTIAPVADTQIAASNQIILLAPGETIY
jgi:hypothetical protein